jgi:hypothetical protein
MRTGRVAVGLAGLAGVVLWMAVAEPAWAVPWVGGPARRVWFIAAAWLTFAAGALLVRRLPTRYAIALIVAGSAILPLSAAAGEPRSSDDLYRYVWDGRVQAAGIDPYRYAPASSELVGLRDGYLWPEQSSWCVTADAAAAADEPLVPGCTLINRPTVHTIYPPVAQGYFVAMHWLSPPERRHRPLQLAGALLALVTTGILLRGLHLVGADPRTAVWWAWCPAVAWEAGNNAHADVLAAMLAGLGVLCLIRAGRARARVARGTATTVAGSVLLGLSIATKLTPALVLPAVLRRRPVLVLASCAATVAAVYLPHVLAVGPSVLGYLPGYLSEEGYATGSRFALATWLLPDAWAQLAAFAVLAAAAVVAVLRADPDRPWHAAALTTGTALLVAAPGYPWYALLLVLLVGLGARPVWLAVAAAGYVPQHAWHLHLAGTTAQRVGYGLALAAVVLGWLIRRRRPVDRSPLPTPRQDRPGRPSVVV